MGNTYVYVTILNPAEPRRSWTAKFLVDNGLEGTESQHPFSHARSTSKAARLRASLLNSTPIRWIGWLAARYLSA